MTTKLILINGCMGIGKTTISRALSQRLAPSVWLDGDWCWMMNPWIITEQNKRMVEDNIAYLLRSFLANGTFEYIIFCWVMHLPEIITRLLERLADLPFELYRISLVCSEEALRARLAADGRGELTIAESVRRLPLYRAMDSITLDTTDVAVADSVEAIVRLIGAA